MFIVLPIEMKIFFVMEVVLRVKIVQFFHTSLTKETILHFL